MENRSLHENYPYAWLDEIIGITLNPEKTRITELRPQQIESIEHRFNQALQNIYAELKARVFRLFSTKKIKVTVSNFYESLRLLENQALNNLARYPADHPLSVTGENLLQNIQDLEVVLRERYGGYLNDPEKKTSPARTGRAVISKILCKLSVDQIGIFLRATDDTRLIVADSMSIIFRQIVPYLSTDQVSEISWNSMRKGTYQMEQRDKDIVIAALEKLILKIRQY